ncbi:MAG: hypothetical protein J6Q53_04915 [Oscillospiraceae bacterium]|nr:hypothetical protein [Oscillospiraceae bacterium]
MISLWHLAWIVPLAASAGAFVLVLFAVGDTDPDWYDEDQLRLRDTV